VFVAPTQSGMNLPQVATLRRSFGPAPATIWGYNIERTLPGGRSRRYAGTWHLFC
jgi:hypothetical protein